MKQIVLSIISLVLAAALLGCGTPAASAPEDAQTQDVLTEALATESAEAQNTTLAAPATEEAEAEIAAAAALTPESIDAQAQTAAPATEVTGTIEGTVLAIAPNDITINMANGNTINLMMTYIAETSALVGDEVKIEYAGDIANRPEAVTITVTKSTPANTINGTVFMHDTASIFIQISSKEVFGFIVNKDTAVGGTADHVVTGDTVALTYSGDLYDMPLATQIRISKAVSDRSEKTQPQKKTEDTTNKSLDGHVTKVTSTQLTMLTSKKNTYSFKITGDTRITGKYKLEAGARVTVYYDGYAAKKPAAKAINVYAPPDPSPTHTPAPSTKTVTGIVDSFGGMYLGLTSGIGFDCAYATISGNGRRVPGEQARVTYYVGKDKMNYATYITFTSLSPDPTPDPVIRSSSGIVTSFGGMYLSLDNGKGFDCAYAEITDNGSREVGDEARVTYYVGSDGMNYATKIRFTSVYRPVPTPEPTREPAPEPTREPTPEPTREPEPPPPPPPPPDPEPEPAPVPQPDPEPEPE